MSRIAALGGLALLPLMLGAAATEVTDACAVLQPMVGHKVKGHIHFERTGETISITGRISGLPPGKHAIAIHMYGDCSAPDGMSAGDHFNPYLADHGRPKDDNRHVGDLGNIDADGDGIVNLSLSDGMIAFYGSNNILGRALVIHSEPDDGTSQPMGNAGSRVACGVIGVGPPR